MANSSGSWMVFVLGSIYLVGELGHYLIGVVSRTVAQDLHYGSKACFPINEVLNTTHVSSNTTDVYTLCEAGDSLESCGAIKNDNGTSLCTWDYSGLGIDYQILAGPSFMAVFTVAGVMWGVAADKFNRVYLLTAATLLFSIALASTALATKFWHLVVCRVVLGIGVSGCSPLAAGMICDVFPQKQRGKAMSVYNCGMYVGYGLSYAIGIYVTAADIFGESWRATFVICGIPGLALALLLILTVSNPEEKPTLTMEEDKAQKEASYSAYEAMNSLSLSPDYEDLDSYMTGDVDSSSGSSSMTEWRKCFKPVIILLVLAACLRRSAGYTLRYNSALYFQVYYPTYDVGWYLTAIYCFGGVGGSILGGVTSDKLVNRLGVAARAVVLAVGQLLATPFAIGLLYLDPPLAFIPQSIGYLFGAMWFGAMFTILVELVPPSIRSSAFGVAFFIMENVGGNLPIIVEYLTSLVGYRTALTIMYPGQLLASSIIFFVCCFMLRR